MRFMFQRQGAGFGSPVLKFPGLFPLAQQPTNLTCTGRHVTGKRRGVTLIFVVSLIVLFLLMGMAFVVLASDFFRSARQRGIQQLRSIDGAPLIERAFYDLLREPSLDDLNSPLRGHSLLGDIYGYGFKGIVTDVNLHPSQQFLAVTLNINSARYILDNQPVPSPAGPEWGGLILTFISGPGRLMTTRIVEHQISGPNHLLLLQPDWTDRTIAVAQLAQLNQSQVIINGRPFSGTGAGRFDARQPPNRAAFNASSLQPNQIGRTRQDLIGGNGELGPDGSLLGYLAGRDLDGVLRANHASTNEAYDTFDFQNMFLAGLRVNGSINEASFFRPELLSHPRGDFRAVRTEASNLIEQSLLVDNLNNGFPDGIWMDIGLGSMTAASGVRFKPLVSYTVVDLDGKINLNAHGNRFDLNREMSEILLLPSPLLDGRPDSQNLHRGVGYGPPEISLRPLLGPNWPWVILGGGGLVGRYGADQRPGMPNFLDPWTQYKLLGYPNLSFNQFIPGTVAGSFGSVMDIHGRFSIGYPDDVKEEGVPVHLPTANVGISLLETELTDSAYELSFADPSSAGPGHPYDAPFTLQELERVLRQADPDANFLSDRLYRLGMASFTGPQTAAYSITTSSFEVPTLLDNLPRKLADVLKANQPGLDPNQIQQQIRLMLPEEVLRGLPMDVNRILGDGLDNNRNLVVDEPGETHQRLHPNGETYRFSSDDVRSELARHLYLIALLATERFDRIHPAGAIPAELLAYRKMIAQWAINVVDFRDRDSIMTPFVVDLNPWDGWDVDPNVLNTGMLNGRDSQYRAVVWGVERPELLITEVLATHDRRTQDLNIDPSGKTTDDEEEPDEDFDSHLVPNVSFFVELYNPWVINEANQFRPPELYDSQLNGVDLQRKIGPSPVWRLAVSAVGQNTTDPDAVLNDASFSRRIYFARPDHDLGPEVYFPAAGVAPRTVQPGLYAVVGSAGIQAGDEFRNFYGRWTEPVQLLEEARQITLVPNSGLVKVVNWNQDRQQMELDRRDAIILPIGLNDSGTERNLGVSDPLPGYTGLQHNGIEVNLTAEDDGFKFTVDFPDPEIDFAFDMPVDQMLDPDHYDNFLASDGLVTGYRMVHLQRLANPLIPYHPLGNPYLTIDSSSIDLVVFNGAETKIDPNNLPRPIRFGSYERGSIVEEDGQLNQEVQQNRHRLLFRANHQGQPFRAGDQLTNAPTQNQSDQEVIGVDRHIFSRNLQESLGKINWSDRNAVSTEGDMVQTPFAWLTWNNRPYASQLELANVPFTSSSRLTRFFDVADEGLGVYAPPAGDPSPERTMLSGKFPHLVNFYSDQLDPNLLARGLHAVFDLLEVPSRFSGLETFLNPDFFGGPGAAPVSLRIPRDQLSNYRYPGKININTVVDERVWNGLMRNYAMPLNGGTAISFSQWEDSRQGMGNQRYGNPLRPANAANRVPLNSMVVPPAECGLYRSTIRGGRQVPLFDFQSAAMHNDTRRSAYFRYDARQRLGNLVTGRSSLFAIWVTVGYFEIDSENKLVNADQGGIEIGADQGQRVRHRGFFIVDRSIPVAFEPGENHNVDRAVLIKRIIEKDP